METVVNAAFLKKYYNGKKIFLTGHTGFKGAWLTAMLHQAGAHLKGYALAPEYDNGLFSLLEPYHMIESVIADIRDKSRLTAELLSFQPDYIFHLAAQPLVRRSYHMPAETFEINVSGTANLLQAMQQLPGKCTAVIVTTDKVYENKEKHVLYNEDDRLGGYDPYSASKACTELVLSSFRNSFFNPGNYQQHQKLVFSARAGNVIGGGDWSTDRLLPDIVRALQIKKVIDVRNPLAVRPWQHVMEPISGYALLAALGSERPQQYSPAFNFGPLPEDHLTVQQLVEQCIQIWGNGQWQDQSDPSQPHEAGLLQLSVERAARELNWIPRLTAAEAIEWTILWYKQPVNRQAECSIEQISQYLSL